MTPVAIALLCALAQGSPPREPFVEFYYRYAQALMLTDTVDAVTARDAWWPPDLEFSERLGIRWLGPGPKIDGASPLLSELASLRAHELLLSVASRFEDAQSAELELRVTSQNDTLRHRVVGIWHDGRWWLRHPLLREIENWPVDEGPGLRQHRHHSLAADSLALAATAEFLERASDALQVSTAQRELLSREHLHILLAPPDILAELVGVPTEGVANHQLDVVLTSHPFHPHELAHLLVNLARGELPVAAHPMLQEGLAVWLGGRSDAVPQDQLELGALALAEQLVVLDRLLAPVQFGFEPADFSYAASAVVVEELQARLGMPELLNLYGELAASASELHGWDAGFVRERILARSRQTRAEFEAGLLARVATYRQPTFTSQAPPQRSADLVLADDAAHVSLWWEGTRLQGEVTFSSPQSAPVLRWSEATRYELRFASGEIGLYDRALGKRLAKRIDAFAPDVEFWDERQLRMRFAIELARLPVESRVMQLRASAD